MVNDNKKVEDFKLVDGESFILQPNQKPIPLVDTHSLQSNEVIVTNRDAKFIFIKDGVEQVVNFPCPSCLILTPAGIETIELDNSISFNGDAKADTSFSADDIESLQNAILAGQDPTTLFGAPAAGNATAAGNVGLNGSSATASFITINYDNDAVLAEAGFDTAYNPQRAVQAIDPNVILAADGGELGSMVVVEGDLTPQHDEQGYPVETSTSIIIDAATLPLESSSFVFDPLSINTLLSELNNDISSGGKAVSFVYDTQTNTIIGTLDGTTVMSIALEVSSINGRDVTVNVITKINQPIDHAAESNSGLVSHNGDSITIDVVIQGADSNGNPLDKPINVDITIKDGANPEFGTDSGTTIDETTQNGEVITGDVPLDVGSDAIHQLDFKADQPDLANLTSNGVATTFTVNGNVLTVVDSDNKPVMVVTIAKDGSYTVEVTGPIDQNDTDIAKINLGVTATDNDGDIANGQVVITVTDGADASGNEHGEITITEGDLTPQAGEQGYPVSGMTTIAIEAGADRLDPTKVTIDPTQLTKLIDELSSELTTGDNQAISFSYDSATGQLVGVTATGEQVVTVSLDAVQAANGHDIDVTVAIVQQKPLNHTDSGVDGLVDSVNDKITIDVPIQVQDTDGDWLDNPANVDITIVDGANPEFGTDSGSTINETTQNGEVITGDVPLDVGSDAIHQLDFNTDQPSLQGLTSNGAATTFTVNGNVLTVVDSHDKPVMAVTIAKDGAYTVEVTGPIDQNDTDIAKINLGVTATDNDGDIANGQVVITVTDGADASGNEHGEITITEGDLTPQAGEQGYPVSGMTTIAIEAGADRLNPETVTIDSAQLTKLIDELSSELTTGDNQAISFSYDSATGQLVGVTATGEQVVTVSLDAVQAANGHDIDVTVAIVQQKPLNHTDSGVDGLVDSVNDKITIDVPIQVQDTDGDWLQKPANVDITIVDGANPEFGTDSGTAINETTQNGEVITGDVPLDVGSDAIHQLDFNADQPSLQGLTSNGAATTFTVNGNVLTVVDSHDKPVMVVTIAKDGAYTVEVTGPIDQNDTDIVKINLGVTATDNDDDIANGQVVITINDGADAGGNEHGDITITEGDLTPQAGEQGYPVSGMTTIVIEAGSDRLNPETVTIDSAQLTKLIDELSSELTTGDNQAISFSYDSATGQLVGVTADGEQVVTVSLDAVQAANGHDIDVTVTINQDKPLNHTDSGVDGLVDSVNDKITIDVPIQVQDSDGDWLDNPANVDITIVDGANPEFGTDSGTTINETTQNGEVITGDVPLNVGSDAIHQLDFNVDQPDLASLTSNGAATTFTVNGNVLTVVDSHDKPVMVVTIAKDGAYTVEVTGPIDQNNTDIANINLGVTATDNDDDIANGQVVITINDGADASGNEHGEITITEGDLTPQAGEQGYPVSGNTTIVIEAGADRLDPTKVTIDSAQLTKLIDELSSELTTGDNQAISFSYDSATGQLVGVTATGEQVVTVSLDAVQAANGHDIDVTVAIVQQKPLNHTDSGVDGLVDSINDKITIDVPIQVQDTDGDWLDNPANVDITIVDGANPEFGTDNGTTINETTQNGQVISGQVPLNVGSDAIHQLGFNADQPSLQGLTSNGAATTFTVNGNVLTVVDSHDKPVMVVTIAKDGAYTVEVTGPIDQNDTDIAKINLGVTATDNDDDIANGQVVITINDGADAGGNEHGDITITEGDLTPQAGEQGYPVSGMTTIAIEAGADRLDPTKVTIDSAQLTKLIDELSSELTTGDNQAISFSYDSATGQLVGVTADGEQVVTVSLDAVQAANGHDIDVTVAIVQQKPLNHTDSGVDGLVDSVNDKITIDVPIQVQDTDGDWLDNPANVDITIVDGANPEFGTDSGSTINETTQNGEVITGDVPLNVGSDAIHQLDFNVDQPDLASLTSNGAATTFTVNGNVLTVVDSDNKPVMVVTIAKDGSYRVEVTGPIDQNDTDIAKINLGVTATDNDDDIANGQVVITINDGADAGGNEHGDITITEGDLTPQAGEQGYPVSGNTLIVIEAGADRLNPETVTIDSAQLTKLIDELSSELTTGDNQAISFSYDSTTGQLVGVTADGEQVVTVSLDAVQAANGHDIDVTVTINQDKPLNHTDSGVDGLVDSVNDKITIDVPIQVQDSDGDWLQKPANVDITIVDGANPEFGTDSGTTINETTQNSQVISGQVPLNVGSDAIHQLDFNADQPSLQGLTSNGTATTFTVNGNVLTVVDSDNKPVMVVTIAKDGAYTVEVTGPIDQNDTDIAKINLGVTATDNDGDTANGQVVITINDGADADGNEHGDITITEGDLTPQAGEQGYPLSGNTTISIEAGADRLNPETVTIDSAQLTKLIDELSSELTTGDNQAISFSYDSATGQLVGVTATGEQVVTVSLDAVQAPNGHDIDVTVAIVQQKPLNHTDSGVDGLVDSVNDKITIDVPIQVQDTDGDWLQKPANVDITIVDGANPEFGTDSGTAINETTQNGEVITGDVPLNVGSDAIHQLDINVDQPDLASLTSNGAATTFTVNGNVLTVVDSDNKPVMVVRIAKDGSYTVEVTGPIDQNDTDIAKINLGVTATDNDGDIANGQVVITVTDGADANGGETGSITITEGDLTPAAGQQGYPVSGDVDIAVKAGVDRLNPSTATIDNTKLTALIDELQSELTSNGEKISFNYDHNTGVLTGTTDGNVVVTVTVTATQAANGHDADIKVSITQHSPLDHNGSDNGGWVNVDGDKIVIDVPVQVKDTDGDLLTNDVNAQITIEDGAGPVIIAAPALTVEESDLASGSIPSGDGESAIGDIVVNSGSDYVTNYKVDVDSFNQQNDITSHGHKITLSQSSEGTYQGIASGNVVFTYYLLPTGRYIFQLHGTIDHPTQGEDQLTIDIPVYAIDNDGDVSGSVNVNVTIKDDIPSVHDVTLATVEDSSSTQENVIIATGADGAEVTALIVDGQHIALSSLEQSGEYRFYEVKDGTQVLGELMIKPNGDTYFIAKDNISQTQEELIKQIGFEVTDGDGDTATGTITLDISDKDAILQVENSIGEEDDGRHSIDPTDNVDPSRNGIAINMIIDGGDNDRGEHVGAVTIQPQTQAHGVFMYNGQPLTVNSDGSVTLPPNAFTVDNTNPPDVKFILQGVTFVPDADYSTSAAGIKFDVTAQLNTTDGGNHPVMNGEFSINVQGIADTPIWNASSVDHYVISEDQDNVLLNVVADLQDTDGSESLFYFITVPDDYKDKCTLEIGGQLLVETSPGSGVYKVTANQMASVEVNPVDNFSGDIELTIQAQSKENSNFVTGHQTADSEIKTVIINVGPVADDAVLKVTRVEANEDQRIDLSNHITLTSLDDNTDGSEALYLQISALPNGAVLYLNDQLLTANADGVYEISYQELSGLSMQPPLDSNVDFSITVNGVVRDVAQVTDANGQVTTETSEKNIGPQSIDITLTGVVDVPKIESENSNWTPLADGKIGLQTTIKEDGEAHFDFKVVSGEHTIGGATDGSETLSAVISGIPDGAKLYDQNGNLQTLVYAGDDVNGQPIYQVNLGTLNDVVIVPPENSVEDITLDVRVVVTENDGASMAFNGELIIHVTPVIDADNYTTTSTGFEDNNEDGKQIIETIINWQPSLTDPQEHITGLALSGLPADYRLFIDGVELNTGTNGKVGLTSQQLHTLLNGGKLTVTAPQNSDQDITLTSTVTVSQTDVDGNKETVTKDITGTLVVDIKAVVEANGHLVVNNNGTVISTIVSGTDGVIDLSHNTGSDGQIIWQNDDTSSSEVIQQVVLGSEEHPIPIGFVIIGGINNGNGSWTVPQSSLDDLKIIAPEGFNGQLTLNINALVQDMSEDGDVSDKVNKQDTITLDFSANTEDHTEKAADIIVDDSYIVTGTEDHSVTLGQQIMNNILTINTANDDQVHDDFTLVIKADNLPQGATISGADFDHVTGEYVLKVPVDAINGTVDLSGITLNLPADYAGDFKFDVTYVTTDTDSGDYIIKNDTIAVQVAPQVDGPKNVEITVVETDGLNADKQPISTSDDKQEQVYDNIAYEDGDIKLDLSMSLKDTDTSETDGKETIQSVTLILADTTNGVFIDINGNVLGTSITVDQSQLDNIHFRPALDFSGKVDINVSTTVVDTVIYDQTSGATVTDTKSFDNTVSFDVIAVNDEIKWQGIDAPIVGDEDTAIPLAGISGSLEDVDGSEHIVSMKLENVPDGFIIEGAVNNGGGVWTITASGESFDLSDIKVRPPHDFSGTVDINIVVYSKEDSLDKPAENRETITIDVQPIADKVDTDITPNVTGDENSPITLDLGIKAYDDENTVKNPNTNMHENGAESLQIIITNVPDSSSFTLPDGVDGSVEKQADGSWIIKVTGSELDTLIFHPGDANNQTVIDGSIWNGDLNLDIRAVDNGVVGTDSVAVDKTIHVDVIPDNDAPVNHLPSDPLTVDEDATLVINGLQITDVDSNDYDAVMDMTVTLSVEHGQLVIGAGVDTSGLTITDNGDGKLIINGDLNLINQLLDHGINYTGDKDFNGTDSLTMTTNDNGNSGAGGPLTDTDTIDITVIPVNDAPVNTVPAAFDVNEDSSHIITGLSIADVDAKEGGTSGQMTVELSVEHGQLAVIATDTQGLTITDNGDGNLLISGDIDKINTLLDAGIEYSGDQNYNGSDQLTMTTSDNGNVGSGGALTDVSKVDITVDAVNDVPINDVPTTITASEDTAMVVEGIKVTDADFNELANNEAMSVTLSVNHGSLSITLPTDSSVEVTGDGSSNVVLKGSMADINAVLDSGVSYTAAENFSGNDELTITTNDGGNTGSGGSLSTTNKVNITVTPKADIPSLSLSSDHIQTAAIQSSLGTMVPLIGLIAAASADASETLTVKMSDLGSAQIVDKAGNVIGTDLGNGEWQITAQDLNDVYIKDLTQGTHTISIAAVSTESDGSQAISPPVNINVVVDDLSATNNIIGQNSASNQANLVIDSTAEATLFGGDGNDILVGGLASDILVGGRGDDILWGGDLDGHGDGVKDTFLWSEADFGTGSAPATDTIMDFEVGIDTIHLGDALNSQDIQSVDDLNSRLNLVEQQGNTEIQIFDDQHQVVQNIILDGVSHNNLFGDNAANMTNADKLDALLNSGNLELSDNFGNQQDNTLTADNQGESLFGFGGNDILVAGQGNDILTGGSGDDVFIWHETSLSAVENTDTITDFELDKDQINIYDLLTDDNNSVVDMDVLLKHVSADVDDNGNLNLDVNSTQGQSQHIVLENFNPQHDLGLMDGASSADIVSSLFNHNVFQVDNNH